MSYNITTTNHKPCIGYLPFSSQISFGIARAVIVICFNSIYVEGQMGEKRDKREDKPSDEYSAISSCISSFIFSQKKLYYGKTEI